MNHEDEPIATQVMPELFGLVTAYSIFRPRMKERGDINVAIRLTGLVYAFREIRRPLVDAPMRICLQYERRKQGATLPDTNAFNGWELSGNRGVSMVYLTDPVVFMIAARTVRRYWPEFKWGW